MDDRLAAMLRGAKNVMNKVDASEGVVHTPTHTPTTVPQQHKPNTVNKAYFDAEQPQLLEHAPNTNVALPIGQQGPDEYALHPVANTSPIQHTYKNLHTSKMSPEILKAMVEQPIVQTAPKINAAGMRTFDLSDVPADMIKGAPQTVVNENIQPQTNQIGQKTITLTETELDAKIKSALFEFMATTFTKTLTEATIKKTIGTLIKEGKIKINTRKK